MAWGTHVFAVGDPLTAAQLNQHEDNFAVLNPYTANNQFAYRSAANVLSPAMGAQVLCEFNTETTTASSNTETTVVTYTLPAGKMAVGDRLRYEFYGTYTTRVAGLETAYFNFGGTSTTIMSVTTGGSSSRWFKGFGMIHNAGVTNAQRLSGWCVDDSATTTFCNNTTLAIDTTAAVTILYRHKNFENNVGTYITLYSFTLVYYPAINPG
jgi:hypothetical protein